MNMKRIIFQYLSPKRQYDRSKGKRKHHLMHKKREYKAKKWWATHA